MLIKPTIDITDTIDAIRMLGARPEGYCLKNGYNLGALDDDALSLITIARSRMDSYVSFLKSPALSHDQRQFYEGAAAAINDFMCVIGYGAAVEDLVDLLNVSKDNS